jgi:hypothetical protein
MLVVIVVVRVCDAFVRVLVRVLRARRHPGVRVAVMLVVVGVLVAVRDRPVLVAVFVFAHATSSPETYQPRTAPTSTIGPVGLFDPPAGSIDTAKAFTSPGRSTFASCVM